MDLPVVRSNEDWAWYPTWSASAYGYPLPFVVTIWTSTGLLSLWAVLNVLIKFPISCPSIGPIYVNPSSSKTAPTLGTAKRLTLPFIFFNSSGMSLPINGMFLTLSCTLSDRNCMVD